MSEQTPTPPDHKVAVATKTLLEEVKSWEIVATLSLLVFTTTLAYEAGYVAVWQVPLELIAFTPENAAFVFVTLLIIGLVSACALNAARDWKWLYVPLGLGFLGLFVYSLIKIHDTYGGLALSVLAAGVAYTIWAGNVLRHNQPLGTLQRRALALMGKVGLILSALLVALPIIGFGAGFWMAGSKEEFLVAGKNPEWVIIRNYGSRCICAEFKRGKSQATLKPGFRLIDLSNGTAPKIKREHLGGLVSQQ